MATLSGIITPTNVLTATSTNTVTNKTFDFDSNTFLNFPSGSLSDVAVISTNTTAVTGTLYVFTASLTLTLPASPAAGDSVGVSNQSGTTTCVIARNGNNIMSAAEDMTVDVVDAGFTLFYADATRGWVIL